MSDHRLHTNMSTQGTGGRIGQSETQGTNKNSNQVIGAEHRDADSSVLTKTPIVDKTKLPASNIFILGKTKPIDLQSDGACAQPSKNISATEFEERFHKMLEPVKYDLEEDCAITIHCPDERVRVAKELLPKKVTRLINDFCTANGLPLRTDADIFPKKNNGELDRISFMIKFDGIRTSDNQTTQPCKACLKLRIFEDEVTTEWTHEEIKPKEEKKPLNKPRYYQLPPPIKPIQQFQAEFSPRQNPVIAKTTNQSAPIDKRLNKPFLPEPSQNPTRYHPAPQPIKALPQPQTGFRPRPNPVITKAPQQSAPMEKQIIQKSGHPAICYRRHELTQDIRKHFKDFKKNKTPIKDIYNEDGKQLIPENYRNYETEIENHKSGDKTFTYTFPTISESDQSLCETTFECTLRNDGIVDEGPITYRTVPVSDDNLENLTNRLNKVITTTEHNAALSSQVTLSTHSEFIINNNKRIHEINKNIIKLSTDLNNTTSSSKRKEIGKELGKLAKELNEAQKDRNEHYEAINAKVNKMIQKDKSFEHTTISSEPYKTNPNRSEPNAINVSFKPPITFKEKNPSGTSYSMASLNLIIDKNGPTLSVTKHPYKLAHSEQTGASASNVTNLLSPNVRMQASASPKTTTHNSGQSRKCFEEYKLTTSVNGYLTNLDITPRTIRSLNDNSIKDLIPAPYQCSEAKIKRGTDGIHELTYKFLIINKAKNTTYTIEMKYTLNEATGKITPKDKSKREVPTINENDYNSGIDNLNALFRTDYSRIAMLAKKLMNDRDETSNLILAKNNLLMLANMTESQSQKQKIGGDINKLETKIKKQQDQVDTSYKNLNHIIRTRTSGNFLALNSPHGDTKTGDAFLISNPVKTETGATNIKMETRIKLDEPNSQGSLYDHALINVTIDENGGKITSSRTPYEMI